MGFTCRKQYLPPTFHNRRSTFVIIREQFFQILGKETGTYFENVMLVSYFYLQNIYLMSEANLYFIFKLRKIACFPFRMERDLPRVVF